jgi:hypothetical protein
MSKPIVIMFTNDGSFIRWAGSANAVLLFSAWLMIPFGIFGNSLLFYAGCVLHIMYMYSSYRAATWKISISEDKIEIFRVFDTIIINQGDAIEKYRSFTVPPSYFAKHWFKMSGKYFCFSWVAFGSDIRGFYEIYKTINDRFLEAVKK